MPCSEFGLINKYFDRISARDPVRLGIGDDAAVIHVPPGTVQVSCFSTIKLDETYHRISVPAETAAQLVETSLSELQDQAVVSKWCTLALSLPYVDEPWIRSFSNELLRLCEVHEMPLAGGDTTRGSGLLVLHATACLEQELPAG